MYTSTCLCSHGAWWLLHLIARPTIWFIYGMLHHKSYTKTFDVRWRSKPTLPALLMISKPFLLKASLTRMHSGPEVSPMYSAMRGTIFSLTQRRLNSFPKSLDAYIVRVQQQPAATQARWVPRTLLPPTNFPVFPVVGFLNLSYNIFCNSGNL